MRRLHLGGAIGKLVATFLLVITSAVATSSDVTHQAARRHIVLANDKLIRCVASECSQLWQDVPAGVDAIYPRQVMIDVFGSKSCPRGIAVLYEKSVSTEEIESALNQQYGKWVLTDSAKAPVKVWRVEAAKFAIQLAVTNDRTKALSQDEKFADALSRSLGHADRSNVAEAGLKSVIYMAFTGTECGSQH